MKAKKILALAVSASLLSFGYVGTAQASVWNDIVGGLFGGSSSSSGTQTEITVMSGKVVDEDNVPISGITVTVAPDKSYQRSTHTDENGNYRLSVPEDYAYITFAGKGWRTYRSNHGYISKNQIWNCSMHHDYISGKVTDRYGNPMHWAKVTVEQNGGGSGILSVYTDENGNYKQTIPEDTYYWVTVEQNGYKSYRNQNYLYGGRTYNYTLYEE